MPGKTYPFIYWIKAAVIAGILWLSACMLKEPEFSVNPANGIGFSQDSVFFDTVITGLTSPSRRFKIYNLNEQTVEIEDIRLSPNSPFAFSLNGLKGPISNFEFPAKDSLWLILSVKPGVTGAALPFLITDSISFKLKGRNETQRIIIEAFGQNVNFYSDSVLRGNIVWADRDRPYFIRNSVLVAKGSTLTIKEGVKVFNFKNSVIFVQGTLKVEGRKNNPVLFAGTRQEKEYDNQPGQWGAIYLMDSSTNHSIEFSIIKNADVGIQVGAPDNQKPPSLLISNTRIANMTNFGLYAFGADITAYNNLITDCGTYQIAGFRGGTQTYIHNTLTYSGNFGFSRRAASTVFTDYFEVPGIAYPQKPLQLTFINNLVSGTQKDELIWDFKGSGNSLGVEGNLIRSQWQVLQGSRNVLTNRDVSLANPRFYNFEYGADSTLMLKRGIRLQRIEPQSFRTLLLEDLNGVVRPEADSADIGCFQKRR